MPSESDALLARNYATNGAMTDEAVAARRWKQARVQAFVGTFLTVAFFVALVVVLFFAEESTGRGGLPRDPLKAAHAVLRGAPVFVSCSSGRWGKVLMGLGLARTDISVSRDALVGRAGADTYSRSP